jgi:hypothetical protein
MKIAIDRRKTCADEMLSVFLQGVVVGTTGT